MCNNEIHQLLIQEDYVNCVFCNEQIQDPGKPERDFCCDSMRLIKDNFLVCKNCGQVHDYLMADEYVDFYENRYRIKRKSIYYRKYHSIPHTRIKNTLKYYNEWWDKVYGHIKDDVNRIILRRHY